MSLPLLKVAVVGHTNVGKTSLLRTLLRDTEFGEVSIHPATTRHVEGAVMLVNGQPALELFDTPGLEDSIALLEHLDSQSGDRRQDGIKIIRAFLESEAARGSFAQEAKALRQLMLCDVALYIIDVRDRVLGKHRDELSILGRCARPIVPVLNFVEGGQAKTAEWREHLARVNMHAVAEFDTVVLDTLGEQRLYEKMRSLLDPFRATLDALIDDRRKQRTRLVRSSADLMADLFIDVAACALSVPVDDDDEARRGMEHLKNTVRRREQKCVDDLLALHRFRSDDYLAVELPITDGAWGLDLFNPESLKLFGIRAGGAAAAGAMAGLAVDAMVGGLTMGAAAATGAAIGALYSAARAHGRRLIERARGRTELRVNDATLMHLVSREIELVQALLRRGHASQDRIEISADEGKPSGSGKLPEPLIQARLHADWSKLDDRIASEWADERRAEAADRLAERIETVLNENSTPASLFR